ncbi:MAG: multiheme c-type cytochrome, partial [Fibrobacterales bacterium]
WRSVNGAPPFIPHEIDNKWKNANDCLSCHKNGGFVMKWKKFTPPMPHDFIGECRMCHNPPYPGYKDGGLATKGAPALNNIVAPGAPPQIPHSTAMRKNCVSCHFGPTAIKEVASPHEERANCTACHQPLAL